MANLSIEGRLKNLKDILRAYNFELVIPNINLVTDYTQEDLTIRCRNATIPGRSFEPIESNFVGTKQFFPGKPAFPNVLAVTFEETEDQKVASAIYQWQEYIFKYNQNEPDPGSSKADFKRLSQGNGIAMDMYLKMYTFKGNNLEKAWRIHNAWPQNIDDFGAGYDQNDSVKFSVTFQYDFWTLE